MVARRSVKAEVLGSIPVDHPNGALVYGYDATLSRWENEFESRMLRHLFTFHAALV